MSHPTQTTTADAASGGEKPLAEQAKHHGRDWAVWWQGSGERGDHIMEVTQSGLGYARELAWIGDQHHDQAGVLVAEHNEQVRRLREVIARQAAAKGLLQAELGRIKAVIPASLTYEVPDAADTISTLRARAIAAEAERDEAFASAEASNRLETRQQVRAINAEAQRDQLAADLRKAREALAWALLERNWHGYALTPDPQDAGGTAKEHDHGA